MPYECGGFNPMYTPHIHNLFAQMIRRQVAMGGEAPSRWFLKLADVERLGDDWSRMQNQLKPEVQQHNFAPTDFIAAVHAGEQTILGTTLVLWTEDDPQYECDSFYRECA